MLKWGRKKYLNHKITIVIKKLSILIINKLLFYQFFFNLLKLLNQSLGVCILLLFLKIEGMKKNKKRETAVAVLHWNGVSEKH